MDGFGRELVDQYYKVGSSLEVMCHVDRLPLRPLPEIIEWRHGNRKLALKNATLGQRWVNVKLIEKSGGQYTIEGNNTLKDFNCYKIVTIKARNFCFAEEQYI